MEADLDDHIMNTMGHNFDKEDYSEFQSIYRNDDKALKDLVADPRVY